MWMFDFYICLYLRCFYENWYNLVSQWVSCRGRGRSWKTISRSLMCWKLSSKANEILISFSIFTLQALSVVPSKHTQILDGWLLPCTCSFARTLTVKVGGRTQKIFSEKVHAPKSSVTWWLSGWDAALWILWFFCRALPFAKWFHLCLLPVLFI